MLEDKVMFEKNEYVYFENNLYIYVNIYFIPRKFVIHDYVFECLLRFCQQYVNGEPLTL